MWTNEERVQISMNWIHGFEILFTPTLVFLPGESHEQRSMAGYGP